MRICFIIQGMRKGGAERVASELCNWFIKQGDSITLILTEQRDEPCYKLDRNINLIYLTHRGGVIMNRLNMIRELKCRIKKLNPDICISFITRTNVYSTIACKLLGKKIIISERNDPARDPKGKVMRILRKIFYSAADGLVFQTKYAQEYFSEKIQRKSIVIANPLSEQLCNYELKTEKQDKIVGVGRLVKQKNFPLLINSFCDIMNEFPTYRLCIYGQGEERETLERLIKERCAEERVFLCGQSDKIYEDISDAQIFVLSSDYEGMPNVLAEAMALGLCSISTDCPAYGSAYLIEQGKNGELVPVNDQSAMSDALKKLIIDDYLRCKLSENATRVKELLAIEHIGNAWLQYINKTLNGGGVKN